MTISYGHGISATQLHLAGAYATMVNGGTMIRPTLLRQDGPQRGERVISEETSAALREMLRAVVAEPEGTANLAEIEGYEVGGKTGSADKPNPQGGYYEDRVIATFASVFPANDPATCWWSRWTSPASRFGRNPPHGGLDGGAGHRGGDPPGGAASGAQATRR